MIHMVIADTTLQWANSPAHRLLQESKILYLEHKLASVLQLETIISWWVIVQKFQLFGGGTETIRIGCATDYITNDFGEDADWAHSSDERVKKDIKDNLLGLDFINDLRSVTFKKKAPSEYPEEFDTHNPNETERKNPNKVHYGFIAQEVKEAMDVNGHPSFPVWSENHDGMQELAKTQLITPLVKAIQELSAKVAELEAKLDN